MQGMTVLSAVKLAFPCQMQICIFWADYRRDRTRFHVKADDLQTLDLAKRQRERFNARQQQNRAKWHLICLLKI